MRKDDLEPRINELSQLEPAQVLRVDARDLDTDLSGYEYFWQGEHFTGVAVEFGQGSDGIISETEYYKGAQHGFYREWYEYPDQLKTEERYRYNTRNGVFRDWHPNGQLKEEAEFQMGTELRRAQWDENGTPIEIPPKKNKKPPA